MMQGEVDIRKASGHATRGSPDWTASESPYVVYPYQPVDGITTLGFAGARCARTRMQSSCPGSSLGLVDWDVEVSKRLADLPFGAKPIAQASMPPETRATTNASAELDELVLLNPAANLYTALWGPQGNSSLSFCIDFLDQTVFAAASGGCQCLHCLA